MSSQQKRGFRLPWAVERGTDEGAAAATLEADAEPTTPDQIEDGVGGDLGEGPFHFADAPTPDASTDVSPEASDVPETTAEAAMIDADADTATTEPTEATPPVADDDAWPTTDQRLASKAERDATPDQEASAEPEATPAVPLPPIHVEGEPRAVRANPLVAGLVKAMRGAAEASRAESTAQLQAEATARVEGIREAATSQSAELRKRADDDIAGIREWSKAEIARLRQETEERIESRRTELTDQTERHSANVTRLVEQVQSTVAAFEADMDRFFERLLAENDPARLASLAEQAPEPPDLTLDIAPFADETDTTGAQAAAEWDGIQWGSTGLEADAAAEAEAAATEGLDMNTNDQWPASVLATARRAAAHVNDFEAAGVANTRLQVNGLTSVAGISAFKGALGQLPGVRSVSVSSGEPGVFIFTVVHGPDADLQAEISGLTAFSARVTEASGDGLTVVAHEPAA
jgi:hypothetical protein